MTVQDSVYLYVNTIHQAQNFQKEMFDIKGVYMKNSQQLGYTSKWAESKKFSPGKDPTLY